MYIWSLHKQVHVCINGSIYVCVYNIRNVCKNASTYVCTYVYTYGNIIVDTYIPLVPVAVVHVASCQNPCISLIGAGGDLTLIVSTNNLIYCTERLHHHPVNQTGSLYWKC